MDDGVNVRVLLEDVVEGLLVRHIDLVEVGAAAGDDLDAVESHLGRVVEVVDNDYIVPVLEEGEGGEGANVAGTTAGERERQISVGLQPRRRGKKGRDTEEEG